MNNTLKFLLSFSLLFISISSNADYTKTVVPQTSLESPATNWAASDDASISVPIGFTFPFGSVGNITQITLNSNGALTASSTYWNRYQNYAFPRSSTSCSDSGGANCSIIAPYWDDIYRRSGTIRYGTFGIAPNRRFVAAWRNTPRYSNNGSCIFQAVLYENGDIRFRYSTSSVSCNSSSGNGSATVGVQENTSIYNQHSYNTTIDLTKDILFRKPGPVISLQKTLSVISDPVNGASNPKAIPGALIEYTMKATNSGSGSADNNSIILTDSIPSNMVLYVNDISGPGTGPVRFVDGFPSSGLSYNFTSLSNNSDQLLFSNNSGATYNYSPSPDAYGLDTNVTNVKMKTLGGFLSSGSGSPNFQFKFRVKVQ